MMTLEATYLPNNSEHCIHILKLQQQANNDHNAYVSKAYLSLNLHNNMWERGYSNNSTTYKVGTHANYAWKLLKQHKKFDEKQYISLR